MTDAERLGEYKRLQTLKDALINDPDVPNGVYFEVVEDCDTAWNALTSEQQMSEYRLWSARHSPEPPDGVSG